MLARYMCPRCFKIYSFNDYIKLPSVPLHYVNGSTKVCVSCGAPFFDSYEGFKMRDSIEIARCLVATVSTVCLVIEHRWGGEDGYFFETAIFIERRCRDADNIVFDDDTVVVARYKTPDEAREGHKRIVEALRSGRGYRLVDVKKLEILV